MATFQRPKCLSRILPELVAQTQGYPGSAEVLVVDNDPAAGAREEASLWADRAVRYVHEPSPGIAAARNRALVEAGNAELLLFIDDDGLPLPGWVDHLVGTWLQWRCAGVSGPVLARFEGGVPEPWVAESGVFDRTIRPTGSLVGGAGSGNLLLHLPQLRELGLDFDEEFGLTGGSDTMLTHAMIARGAQIRWCDEAEVYDFQSPDRLSRDWVRRRSFRTGNDWSRVALALAPSGFSRMLEQGELVLRGLKKVVTGGVNQVRGVATSNVRRQATGACEVSSGLGAISGALGGVSVEYGRPTPLAPGS